MRLLRKHSIGLTSTEFDYLDGVTSGIQTQMNDKAPLASPSFTGTVDLTGTTVSLDDNEISGDKVSGGTIGAGTFNGTIGSTATFPTGHVIQTIHIDNEEASTATSSGSLQRDTNLTGTIYNVKETSHVLIFSQCDFMTGGAGQQQLNCAFGLFREDTEIMASSTTAYYINTQYAADHYGNLPVYWSFLDESPATGTNNYYQGYKANSTGYSVYIYGSYRALTMLEIAQ